MLRDNDVAGLLATKREVPTVELLENVTVAHCGLLQCNAFALHGEGKSQIAHDRGYERVVAQVVLGLHAAGQDRHNLVTVDDVAFSVDGEAAVRITVVCHAKISTVFDDGCLDLVHMSGTGAIVNVESVRLVVDRHNLGTGGLVRLRGDLGRRTVRTVYNDLDALQAGAHRLFEVRQVTILRVRRLLDHAADTGAGWPAFFKRVESPLNFVLDLIRQFVATRGEKLDAVIRHGVVGRGDHHTDVRTVVISEVRQAGSRNHADTQDIHAFRRHARSHRCRKHFAGHAWVAANQRRRAALRGLTVLR